MPSERIGITIAPDASSGGVPVYESAIGADVFEVSEPYLMSDGLSLQSPILAYNAGGPVGIDSVGQPVDALPVKFESPSIVWAPFTLTAGDSGEWFGYSNGDIASPPFNPPFGSISNEPTDIADLEAFYIDDSSQSPVAIFSGDIRSSVAMLPIVIGAYSGVTVTAELFGGNTVNTFTPGADLFVDAGQYLIELGG